ncbi:MAG: hypothetical protein JWM93_645 [Frankiales bacterium]|nr:hypothetical protein [Frankiales bacterium]
MKHLRPALLLAGAVAAEAAAFVLLVVVVLVSHLNGSGPAVDDRGWLLLAIAGVVAALPVAVAAIRSNRRALLLGAGVLAVAVAGLGYLLATLL